MKPMFAVPVLAVLVALLGLAGCEKRSETAAKPAPTASQTPAADQTTAKADEPDWCTEHGVPESVCTRCHPKLIAAFKQKGDWCKEHNLPESQCIECHPELKEKFAAMAPKKDK